MDINIIIGRRAPGAGSGLHRSATPRGAVPGDPEGPPRRPARVTAIPRRSAPDRRPRGHETPRRPPPHPLVVSADPFGYNPSRSRPDTMQGPTATPAPTPGREPGHRVATPTAWEPTASRARGG